MTTHAETLEMPETKRKLVDAGVLLMRTKGFNATTVDDICSEATVTKGAFFHYFKSKDEIAQAAIQRFGEGRLRAAEDAPFRKFADPLDRVYGRLDFVKEYYSNAANLTKGCLIGTFAQELSFTHPELRSACQERFARIARDFEEDLAAAKAAHAPQATFDPKKVAQLYLSICQGSFMLVKAAESNTILVENLDQFRGYLQALFGAAQKSPETSHR